MFGGAKPWAERSVKPKVCKECGNTFQPVSGGNVYCTECGPKVRRARHAKAQREWRAADPDRHARNKARHDLKKYGMSVEDYFAMLKAQGGRCQICRTDDPRGRGKTRPFAVDHCHASGKVRALLCHKCNGALGMVEDNPKTLGRMIEYLRIHSNG